MRLHEADDTKYEPVKVFDTGESYIIMHGSHELYKVSLDLRRCFHVESSQKALRDGHQRLPRPLAEPVHGAAGDESRKFERPAAEFVSDLISEGKNNPDNCAMY